MRVASSLKNLLATKPTATAAFSAALALATGLAALAAVQPAAHAAIATCSGFNPCSTALSLTLIPRLASRGSAETFESRMPPCAPPTRGPTTPRRHGS